jgi:flagellar assembly protein FliH
MPSSPEITRPWTPEDLSAAPVIQRPEPHTSGLALFEVAADAGVPEALLQPARRAAEAEGFSAGWAAGVRAGRVAADDEAARVRAGRAAAEREHRELIMGAVGAVQRAADQLEAREVASAESIENLIIKVAYDLAEAVLGAALRDDLLRGEAAIRRALEFAPTDEPVTVAVNPADHAALRQDGIDGVLAELGRRTVSVVTDPRVAPGDAVATAGAMTIEARLGAALARARGALLDGTVDAPLAVVEVTS